NGPLAVKLVAQDVDFRVPSQSQKRRALSANVFHDPLQATDYRGQHLFQARRPVGRKGQELQSAEKGVRGGGPERLSVQEQKVLRNVLLGTWHTPPTDANDLQRRASRHGDSIIQHVTGNGGEAQYRRISLRGGE